MVAVIGCFANAARGGNRLSAPDLIAASRARAAVRTPKELSMAKEEFGDAIALLKADHRKVEDLFEKFENARGRKQAIAEEICNELKIHTTIEEEIFYPAFRGKIEDDTLNEAYVEHDGAKVLINDIMSGGDDEFYDAKVKVLSEDIKHHVHEEEMSGDGMFAQCRKTDVDLKDLRERMMTRKQELMTQVKAGGLPPAQLAVLKCRS
jgi:Hemerythrin HHE cation binding domain